MSGLATIAPRLAKAHREWRQSTFCSFCELPLCPGDRVVEARTKDAWAHFTCWYDGGPFERDIRQGRRDG